MKDVLMFSCGLDSLAAWFFMGRPQAIYVDMKTKYSKKEKKCIKKLQKLIPDLNVKIVEGIDLGQFEYGGKAFIPHRNLILACIGSNYGDRIIIAGIEDDCVEDKNPKAFKAMSTCMNIISKPGKKVEVYSPFWKWSKSDIISFLLQTQEKGKELIRTSVSCYSEEDEQCGYCPSCLRKAIAMETCGMKLDIFKHCPAECELIPEYIEEMQKKNSKYTKRRIEETLEVFDSWGYEID